MADGAKILIIDDDPDFVKATRVVLESRDHSVVSAESGKEGLKKVESENPDLIMLDIMMEKGDIGFDVCRTLKRDERYKNIPILMITAIKEKTGLDFQKEAGDEVWLPVDDYVGKPLKPDELISKVDALLKKK